MARALMPKIKPVRKQKVPRRLSIVKFNFERLPKSFHNKYPFKPNRLYVFLGEISNMPEHCIVVDYRNGRIHSGYHTENFIELDEEEV
jgi:hypothetical protein